MNLIYIDPGLYNNLGHHANSCRHIVGEARGRGMPCAVLGYIGIEPSLKDELFATPWFRCNTYGNYDTDPVCGWLMNFEVMARTTAEDLSRLGGVSRDDIVYLNSAQPAQFMGVVRWAQSLPEDQRPTVVLEFGTDPGLVATDTGEGRRFSAQDPRQDCRATLLRYTARILGEADQRWLRLATFDAQASGIFQMLLDFPVGTLPLPRQAATSCRDRSGTRPITIAVLGHQRLEKGYDMVPELAARLLNTRNDIRLLIHNGWPEGLVTQQNALRALAAADSRVILNEETADLTLWNSLLEQSDLIVCPYNRNRFISSYSAVASEALSNAIPLVVPEGTTMHAVMREFGDPGTVYTEETPDALFGAVVAAVEDFDRLAGLAKQASNQWGMTRGTAKLVDTLLSWRSAP